eukprot:3775343-Rhodomonas_salina.3
MATAGLRRNPTEVEFPLWSYASQCEVRYRSRFLLWKSSTDPGSPMQSPLVTRFCALQDTLGAAHD